MWGVWYSTPCITRLSPVEITLSADSESFGPIVVVGPRVVSGSPRTSKGRSLVGGLGCPLDLDPWTTMGAFRSESISDNVVTRDSSVSNRRGSSRISSIPGEQNSMACSRTCFAMLWECGISIIKSSQSINVARYPPKGGLNLVAGVENPVVVVTSAGFRPAVLGCPCTGCFRFNDYVVARTPPRTREAARVVAPRANRQGLHRGVSAQPDCNAGKVGPMRPRETPLDDDTIRSIETYFRENLPTDRNTPLSERLP